VVPGLYPPDVLGTPDYIAPEVLATQGLPLGDPKRNLPSNLTDAFAAFGLPPTDEQAAKSPAQQDSERADTGPAEPHSEPIAKSKPAKERKIVKTDLGSSLFADETKNR